MNWSSDYGEERENEMYLEESEQKIYSAACV